ncbi:MAG TPA: aryl-sulfate sulfotransferase [Steroidobacteraceae bacterium]|nr:aryl-sulfate sulfotransferase [Steroidobacteraceae bacterium]
MKLFQGCIAFGVLLSAAGPAPAAPSVYPTGTTLYQPDKTWNGYTVLSLLREPGVVVIDMNGRVVKQWEGFDNSAGGPARILPGGDIIAAAGARTGHQESLRLVQKDFSGAERWSLQGEEDVTMQDGTKVRSLRQHHDWQRADFPAGYYSPSYKPQSTGSATLVLSHTSRQLPAISDLPLEEDYLVEYGADGRKRWEWRAGDHIDELGFSPAARAAIKAGAGAGAGPARRREFDWLHVNSAAWVGPNRWFDAGDRRFAPDNVLISSRQASLLAIVARDGHVVWRMGPDFRDSPLLMRIGQIIGQHNAHLIPPGLPGAGNLLVFDNGGSSGYGFDTPIARDGYGGLARSTSRVLEIDPVKLELVWSYTGSTFFATNISGAQRLPNGNTLITEGPGGRVFEVTPQRRIVWEFIQPAGKGGTNSVYRAYRLPYEWIPQLQKPVETAVTPPAQMQSPRDPPVAPARTDEPAAEP